MVILGADTYGRKISAARTAWRWGSAVRIDHHVGAGDPGRLTRRYSLAEAPRNWPGRLVAVGDLAARRMDMAGAGCDKQQACHHFALCRPVRRVGTEIKPAASRSWVILWATVLPAVGRMSARAVARPQLVTG
jgi:hypothetical protein